MDLKLWVHPLPQKNDSFLHNKRVHLQGNILPTTLQSLTGSYTWCDFDACLNDDENMLYTRSGYYNFIWRAKLNTFHGFPNQCDANSIIKNDAETFIRTLRSQTTCATSTNSRWTTSFASVALCYVQAPFVYAYHGTSKTLMLLLFTIEEFKPATNHSREVYIDDVWFDITLFLCVYFYIMSKVPVAYLIRKETFSACHRLHR
jgi:hypothetical protein